MNIRAKFMLQEHRIYSWHPDRSQHTFVLRPQYDDNIPEDQRFHQATPTGELTMLVDNPAVVEYLSKMLNKQFYLDFTPAE